MMDDPVRNEIVESFFFFLFGTLRHAGTTVF